jgi:hypothetical protein
VSSVGYWANDQGQSITDLQSGGVVVFHGANLMGVSCTCAHRDYGMRSSRFGTCQGVRGSGP